MLAYRHQFHAGNFADVFKHALLVRLLLALRRKDKPFVYLDTHAGAGRYDLEHPWAQKNAEFRDGIARIFERDDVPPLVAPYLAAVRSENPDGRLRWYPGSPRIARGLLRAGDRALLTELNKKDCAALETLFARDRRVAVRLMDGYQSLKAQLPPKERRGLVLIDSSFDRKHEFERLATALQEAHARWATGVYALWFPLMEPAAMRAFERRIEASGIRRVLWLELRLGAARTAQKLSGCGMIVVNPPYGFAEEAAPLLDWLARALAAPGNGRARCRLLVGE
ncbi:MAG TPA: 23S rRNA (adenine(2030)-N(6))-methyltransferase RlmJ [Burkholderiales bacterium]|nr:23S rRNA (adenine(2030)-N(6))-methyltransferase RlmJ [Burkholderiales bacterium]